MRASIERKLDEFRKTSLVVFVSRKVSVEETHSSDGWRQYALQNSRGKRMQPACLFVPAPCCATPSTGDPRQRPRTRPLRVSRLRIDRIVDAGHGVEMVSVRPQDT
jgi:hypothetical protein